MKLLNQKIVLIVLFSTSIYFSFAQCGAPTYQFGNNTPLNHSIFNLPCSQSCVTIKFQSPHLKTASDYVVIPIGYNPFPYITPTGVEDPVLYVDDLFSNAITLPFSFCFYDSSYSKIAVGSNGLLTFDETNGTGSCANAYTISGTIPRNGGTQCSPNAIYYPKASVMGNYSDLDPSNSPPDRKIQWESFGASPCRKFVISFYHTGIYGTACGANYPNTFQIVLNESTGLIDVYFEEKQLCTSSSNSGNAILGIQDWTRTKAVAAPGKNATQWTAQNEGYSFVPSGGISHFISAQLYTLSGTLISTADTTTTTPGILDISFPSLCPTSNSGQYVVKTIFSSQACGSPGIFLESLDTITVNKTNNLNATATATQTACGVTGTGSITVTVPAGIGTAPYTYILDGGAPVSGASPYTFNGLNAGPHTVVVTDAGGSCSSIVNIPVTSTGVLNVSFTQTNTTCTGAANGSITVTPTNASLPVMYAIDGGPFIVNGGIFTNLAPGTHLISVQDAGGCSANLQVPITSGLPITMTTSSTNTSCPGANNATITVTSATGTAPYQYSINGSPFQSSNTFTGLAPGTYFISLVDGAGCTITNIPVTVTDGATTLTGTAASTSTSCSGVNNGSITVTPTSGVGSYTYSLNGGAYQSSNIFTGLAPGTYTVMIKEAGTCTSAPISVNVAAGSALLATATTTAASCSGGTDGTITVTPTNGSGLYTYALDGGTAQSGNVFSNVTAGSHSIVVTDGAGCISAPISVSITAGPALTGTATTTATSCNDASNGTITATATNGVAPYQYSLDGGTFQSGNTFTGVSSGSHNVVIKSGTCVSANITVTVAAGASLNATTSAIATTCSGAANGSITVTAPTNGTAPYQYSINGNPPQTGNIFNGLTAGTYTIVVSDAGGCNSGNLSVTVNSGAALNASLASATATSCNGAANGSIIITAPTNGTAPYQYSINGNPPQVSNTFNGLTAGSYTIVVTDAGGCNSGSISATVNSGAALNASLASTTATTCSSAANGSITITAPTNGTAPYQYSINGNPPQASNTFTNLAAGSYSIVVTDAGGCNSGNISATIAAGAVVTGTTTSTATACVGVNNGTITVTPANGTAPYQYSIDGGTFQASNIFTNVSSGSHYVVVQSSEGCTSSSIQVTVDAASQVLATTGTTSTTCPGVSNGTITVNPTNGSAPYQYSIDGYPPQSGNVFTNLAAGTHNILISDSYGCTSGSIAVTVNAGPPITATLSKTDVTCNGTATGTITAAISANATAPIQFSLDNVTFQASNVFSGLTAGTYTVYFTDASGCANTQNITVNQPAILALSSTTQPVICNGQSNGVITVNGSGGTAPYQYSLDGTTYQSSNSFNLAAGTYTVYIKDANGCTATQPNITVTEPPVLAIFSTATTNATCDGGSDGTITVSLSGGNPPYQYSVDGTSFQATNVLNVGPGTYTVTVKDNKGCTTTMPNIIVGLTNNLSVVAAADPAPICEGTSVQLQLNTNANQYAWTPATGLNSTTAASPTASPSTTTLYTVNLTLGRCTATDDILVTVNPAPIPDAGPDGDICYGQSYQLQGSGGVSYSWSPSDSLSSTTIANPVSTPAVTKQYYLTVVDALGCQSLTPDIVTVNVTPPIQVFMYPGDTIVYEGDQIQLHAVSAGTYYNWTPATGLSDATIADPVVTAGVTGSYITYHVITTTSAGCSGDGFVTIKVYKGPDIYLPNAFTPNGDGLNETFKPFTVGIKTINYFKIFNRWGQMIYSSTGMDTHGWDGKYLGVAQGSGAYVWVIEAITSDNRKIFKKGTVTLVR